MVRSEGIKLKQRLELKILTEFIEKAEALFLSLVLHLVQLQVVQ